MNVNDNSLPWVVTVGNSSRQEYDIYQPWVLMGDALMLTKFVIVVVVEKMNSWHYLLQ